MNERRDCIRVLLARLSDSLDRIDRRLSSSPASGSEPLVLPVDVFAKKLSVSISTIKRMLLAKELKSVPVAGRTMIPVSELSRILGTG